MPLPPMWALQALAALCSVGACLAQEVFINEIHYDNASGDVGEFVEIAGPAGENLSGFSLVFYNGATGSQYDSVNLSGTLPNEAGGFGALAFFVAGIQNGAPDGVALMQGATVHEFLSYEGAFTAGAMSSVDIGVSESSATPIGDSLQRTGTGTAGTEFNWIGPAAESPGTINSGQSFAAGEPTVALTVTPSVFAEDAGANAAVGTLTLSPPPASPKSVDLSTPNDGEISLPESVVVGVSGSATFDIGALAGGVSDGDSMVPILASAPFFPGEEVLYRPAFASVTVIDIDPPAARCAALRLASYNVQNGIGQPGDPPYEASLRILRRVRPDVIAFTEADPENEFAELKDFLASLGMAADDVHFATTGEAFAGQEYSPGDFGSGQAIAVASRWPITAVAQIGRGEPGRTELTRFPLFVQVEVPGTPEAISLVALHLKAGNTQADIFRRAVEGYRIRQHLEAMGLSGAGDNLFVIGDVNEDFEDFLPNSVFTGVDPATHVFGDGSTFPGSYLLGSDLAAPGGISLDYTAFPAAAFAPLGVRIIDSRQLDGATRTYNVIGDARLDYIMAGDRTIANALPQTEVYNSLLEPGHDGLPKTSRVPIASDSYVGSDHHLVFGDFALDPVPQIVVDVTPPAIDEDALEPIVGTVAIVPAAAGDTEVSLLPHPEKRFVMPATVTVPAGGTASFPIALNHPGDAAPDAELRVTGYAPGHMSGHDFVAVTSRQAMGSLLFSGYVEPPSGGAPKAVEIVNASVWEINFGESPARLLVGVNGQSPASEVLLLRDGKLAPGAVFVIGGDDAGEYLVGEGLLADPGVAFGTFENGTPFLDAEGEVVFVKRQLFFNGDDALAIQVSNILADTFGTVGQDPGSGWVNGGVSSANQNLALRDDVATGSAGWTDPSERWVSLGEGSSLAGFGIPPALDDAYFDWVNIYGLYRDDAATGQDLERDGRPNLLEYAFGGDPYLADGGVDPDVSVQEVGGLDYLVIEFRRLVSSGRAEYSVEISGGLEGWVPAATVPLGVAVPDGPGYERVRLRLAEVIGAGSPRLLRLRVRLP